jgi:hypothetical protein
LGGKLSKKEGEMTTNSGANGGKEEGQSSWVKRVPVIAAIVILVAFGLFIYVLLGRTGVDEAEWGRYVYLFGGVEAIAFAAAGVLLGREVHRAQAESAEKRATKAESEVKKFEPEAVKGRALADFIEARAEARRAEAARAAEIGIRGTKPSAELGSVQAELDEISSVAKKLFP